MREIMLIIHFLGIAMGLGTSFAFMFLGITSSKMEPEEAKKFQLNTLALARMGHIGLVLLLVSGGYLITPYLDSLMDRPLFIAKLVLFLVLGALIGIISSLGKKAKLGDADTHLAKIPTLGRIALLTGLAIVILAVYVFH